MLQDSHIFDKNDKSISLISNSPEYLQTLNLISEKAHKMFESNAYIHHYNKFGLEKDDISDHLTVFENIIMKY